MDENKNKNEEVDEPAPADLNYVVDADFAYLFNAEPNCDHDVQEHWSGVKCTKCDGWFCF